MNCESCLRELKDGDQAEVVRYGEIVAGQFVQTEPETIHHAECPDEDEDEDIT
jgi:hypothetical protein